MNEAMKRCPNWGGNGVTQPFTVNDGCIPQDLAIRPATQAGLGVLSHHRGIVVTSAGVRPPRGAPETIGHGCDVVEACPERRQA